MQVTLIIKTFHIEQLKAELKLSLIIKGVYTCVTYIFYGNLWFEDWLIVDVHLWS